MHVFARAALALALLIYPALPASAQSLAALEGSVTNAEGAVVAGATIAARGAGGDVAGASAPDGKYRIDGIAPGSYDVRVTADGFAPARAHVVLVAGATVSLNVSLVPSTASLVTIAKLSSAGGVALSRASAPSLTFDAQRYAWGNVSVGDMLAEAPNLSVLRPLGGGSALPSVVSLRGSDPTETLVEIDGHEVNNGNTGDFDVSLIDPEALQGVELVYGISPSSLAGPNTTGGAVNLRTLEPTREPHALLRTGIDSQAGWTTTLQTTGSAERFGYAVSLHRVTSPGELSDRFVGFDAADPQFGEVDSAMRAQSALAKVRYAIGEGGYVQASFREQAAVHDLSGPLTALDGDGLADNDARGASTAGHNAAYGFDLRLPVGGRDASGAVPGALTFRHLSSTSSLSVTGNVADSISAYLFNNRDVQSDDTLEYDRDTLATSFSLKAAIRNETLTEPFDALSAGGATDQALRRRLDDEGDSAPGASSMGQTQRSIVARYAFDVLPKLRATTAAYYSSFSTFGTSLDPRAGLVWTPSARTVLRASAGTTFQSPQLSELFVPDPLPDASTSLVRIGNPALRPDHATEYDAGIEQLVGGGAPTRLVLDLYRTNLRTPEQLFVPAGGTGYAFPVNVGDAVYDGLALRAERAWTPTLRSSLAYSIDRTYPATVPPGIGDGTLVAGQQFLGIPMHRGAFELDLAPPQGWQFAAGATYEGNANEYNLGPLVTLRAAVGYRLGPSELSLSATNLAGTDAFGFTRSGAGVPYAGASAPIATDAYALPAPRFVLSFTHRT